MSVDHERYPDLVKIPVDFYARPKDLIEFHHIAMDMDELNKDDMMEE